MPRRALHLLVLLLLVPLAPGLAGAAEQAACPGFRVLPGVGPVCPQPNGLYLVLSPDGDALGTTHGVDPLPVGPEPQPASEPEPFTPSFAYDVQCTSGATGEYYTRVVYARSTTDADDYAANVSRIRYLVAEANKRIDDAALATGDRVDLRVKCTSGQVDVANAVLTTPMGSASFSTIVSDLKSLGYNDPKVKYWVYYDDRGACSCGGTAHVYADDDPGVGNANNGNAAAMFAVTFGINSTRTWLHELGHNLGAVQFSAPHTTGALHCTDGLDIMCYNDGGPNGGSYTTSACAVEVFDCGKDDYFHIAPAFGSYLYMNWNIGNRVNRYLAFHTPRMLTLNCPAAVEVGKSNACNFSASDDSPTVRYDVAWGDATTTTTAFVAPGTSQAAVHTYAALGTYTVSVTATDSGSPALTSPARATTTSVVYDLTPPVVTLAEPKPGFAYDGCAIKQAIPIARVVYVDKGCVKATVTDAKSAIAGVQVYLNNVLVGSDTTAPYQVEWSVTPVVGATLKVTATDAAGNVATVLVTPVDAI